MDKLEATEQLDYIRHVIEDTKNTVMDPGWMPIAWGICTMIGACASQYYIWISSYDYIGPTWAILIGGMWIVTFLISREERRKARVTTFSSRVCGMTWAGLGIAMTLVGFVGIEANAHFYTAIMPVISGFIGVGFFVTGVIYQWRYLIIAATLWWIGLVLMFFMQQYQMLLYVPLIFLTQVVPGFILRSHYKKSLRSTAPVV